MFLKVLMLISQVHLKNALLVTTGIFLSKNLGSNQLLVMVIMIN